MNKYLLTLIALMLTVMAFADVYTIGSGTGYESMLLFNSWEQYSWNKAIFTKDEINDAGLFGSSNIIAIGIQIATTPTNFTMTDQRIYGRHTRVSSCDNTQPDSGNFQLLYQGDITYSTIGWLQIILDSPFAWDGDQNIEFLFESHHGVATYGTKMIQVTNTNPVYMAAYQGASGAFPQGGTGTLSYKRQNLQLVTASAEPPPSATLVSPANGLTMVSNTATLNWNSVLSASGYKLYFGTSTPPDYVGDLRDQTTYNPGTLAYNTPYYWKVIPYQDDLEAEHCPVWSFTTAPEGLISIGTEGSKQNLPVDATRVYCYSQSIYLQGEIDSFKPIEKIWYYWNGASSGNNSNEWVVFMGHTNKTVFSSYEDWVPFSALTEVFDGTLNIPATPGWIEIELDTPFLYNNTDNLVIAVDENSDGSDGYAAGFFYCTQTPGQYRSMYRSTDYAQFNPNPEEPSTAGYMQAGYPNIVMQLSESPILSYTPNQLDFGTVVQNEPSVWRRVTVTNTGGSVLNLDNNNFGLAGANPSMFQINYGNLPADLEAEQSVDIPVRVLSSITGPISATLQITWDGNLYEVGLNAVVDQAGAYIIGSGTIGQYGLPIHTWNKYGWCKAIVTQTELNNAGLEEASDIISIGLQLSQNPTPVTMSDQRIYARHTMANVCDNTQPDSANFLLIYQGGISYSVIGWKDIILTSPFAWNGEDNIEFLFENHSGEQSFATLTFSCTNTSPDYMAASQHVSDNAFPQGGTGSLSYNRPNLKLVIGIEEAPPAATLVSPANALTMVSNTTTLNWEAVLGATGYKVYFGTSNQPVFVQDVGNQTAYNPGTLNYNTPYYWKVVPYINALEAEDCPVWSFTTTPEDLISIGAEGIDRSLPIYPFSEYSYSQSIYLQSEITGTNRPIGKIWYYWNGASTGNNSNEWVVYMANTDKTTFSSSEDWIPYSALTQVFDGTLNIPASPGWVEIELDTPFAYNNTNNLAIAVHEKNPDRETTRDAFFYSTETIGYNRSLLRYSSSFEIDPEDPTAGNLKLARPNIVMQFAELSEDPIFSYSPTQIDFGMLLQNEPSAWKNVTVSNIGGGEINLTALDFDFTGTNGSMFEINPVNLPAQLETNQSVVIPVRATSTIEGPISATLQITWGTDTYEVDLAADAWPHSTGFVGNENNSNSLPFAVAYEDARMQTLFTADELWDAGAYPGQLSRIGYKVRLAQNHPMNNFLIRAKAVPYTTTSLSGFDTTGLTTCYGPTTINMSSQGWHYFIFDTPIVWNGIDNIIIDVSFDNTSSAMNNAMVDASNAPGMTWGRTANGESGNTMTGGGAESYRPNTALGFPGPISAPPVAPTLTSPANQTTGLPIEGFELSWDLDYLAGGQPYYYRVYLYNEDLGVSFGDLMWETTDTSLNPATYSQGPDDPIEFDYDQQWYWKVSAHNSYGSNTSIARWFKTEPDPIPSLPYYQDFGTNDEVWPLGWTQTHEGDLYYNTWYLQDWDSAGGESCEMVSEGGDDNGITRLISPPLKTNGVPGVVVKFKHILIDYQQEYEPECVAKVQYSYDLETWYDSGWSISTGMGDLSGNPSVPISVDAPITYFAWVLDGYHWSYWSWTIDDVAIELPTNNDVGVLSWDLPYQVVPENTTVTPQATVKNFGLSDASFTVTCEIGDYLDTQTVTNLSFGQSQQITFTPVIPTLWFANEVTVTTVMPSDTNSENDVLHDALVCLDLDTTAYAANLDTNEFVRFNLATPQILNPLPNGYQGQSYMTCGEWVDDKWMAVDFFFGFDDDGGYFEINPVTGDYLPAIGQTYTMLNGIAYDPANQQLYGVMRAELYKMNKNTGAVGRANYLWRNVDGVQVTLESMSSIMVDIVYDNENEIMYAIDVEYDCLWKINPNTYEATFIGNFGVDLIGIQDAAFDNNNGLLFLTAYTGYDHGILLWVDTITGRAYKVGPLGNNRYTLDAFAIPYGLEIEPPVLSISDTGRLSWDPVQGAASYNVYSSDDPYGAFELEINVSETSYSPGLSGAKKFYHVRAVSGRSASSRPTITYGKNLLQKDDFNLLQKDDFNLLQKDDFKNNPKRTVTDPASRKRK